jgi:probable 2-oxoglutarate dehydrogenase E1 component DHKTD1
MRMLPAEQQEWIHAELQNIYNEKLDAVKIGQTLQIAKQFDEFLAAKFPTVKRYGLEGSETILLWFDTIINQVEKDTHAVIGMTHRGRNNLLICLLGMNPEIMFGKMSGMPEVKFNFKNNKFMLKNYSENF